MFFQSVQDEFYISLVVLGSRMRLRVAIAFILSLVWLVEK